MSIIRKAVIIFFVFSCFNLFSQNRSNLELKRKKIFKQIQYTNKLLNQTRKKRTLTVRQVNLINYKINNRQKFIHQLENDLSRINNDILENQITIERLKNTLEKIKLEYSKLIYYAYKNRSSYQKFAFIFSSASFNQAYRRLKYLQNINNYRRKQYESIIVTKNILKEKNLQLIANQKNKTNILNQRHHEKLTLLNEKKLQNNVINHLKLKENKYKSILDKNRKLAKKLQRQIQVLIAKEIKHTKSNSAFKLTPEQELVNVKFGANKLRLPWPTKHGIVTQHFGSHQHPFLKYVKVRNDGVDISTVAGESVRSVFEGEVRKVIYIQGLNKTVIIRHGKYITVYSNLSEVFVKVGDRVSAKQPIGVVHEGKNDGIGSLKFQIWRENQKLDPEKWLSKN